MLSVILKRIEIWYKSWLSPKKDVPIQIQVKEFEGSIKDETVKIAQIENSVRILKLSLKNFDDKVELIHERLIKLEQSIQESLIFKINK